MKCVEQQIGAFVFITKPQYASTPPHYFVKEQSFLVDISAKPAMIMPYSYVESRVVDDGP